MGFKSLIILMWWVLLFYPDQVVQFQYILHFARLFELHNRVALKMFPLLTILLVLVSASVVTGYQWQRIAHQHNHARSYSIASKQHIALLPVPARWATSSRTSNNVERSPAITNLKYGEVKPRVCRPIEDADRVALASLKVGQKLRGRIISVAE